MGDEGQQIDEATRQVVFTDPEIGDDGDVSGEDGQTMGSHGMRGSSRE